MASRIAEQEFSEFDAYYLNLVYNTNIAFIDFQFFGHFGNLVNQIKGSGCEHMKFLTFGTSLHKMGIALLLECVDLNQKYSLR